MVQGSRGDPTKWSTWEKETQRSERAFAEGGSKGYGACGDAAGPVIVYGVLAGMVYGVVLMLGL